MKRSHWSLLLGSAALVVVLGAIPEAMPALGADLAVKAKPVVKAPVAAPFSWTGWYIGANAGFGVGQGYGTFTSPGVFEAFNAMPAGGFGGGQLGFNYQIFGSFVVGAETDIQGAGISDNRTCLLGCIPASFAAIDHKLNWFGTTRARVGLATGPVLSYVTGGVAYGGIDTGVGTPLGSVTNSTTKTGWTWGAGIEAALGGNWTAKAEYIYLDLGSTSVSSPVTGTLGVKNQEQIFRGGINYRFGPAAPFGPTRNWAGFFAGGTFGDGLGRNDSRFVEPLNPAAEAFFLSPRGWDGGGIVGYNWQFGSWVVGVEGDFQGSTGTGYLTGLADGTTIDQKLTWFGTARGRLGYGAGEALFYVTGGGAWGEVKESITQPQFGIAGSFSHTKSGFAVGGGIENRLDVFGMLGPNWTTRTEYLFVDLGSVSDVLAGQTLNSSIHEHVWRTVVSYKF